MSSNTYLNYLKKRTKERRMGRRPIRRARPQNLGKLKGKRFLRYQKLIDVGVEPEEAGKIARSVIESKNVYEQAKKSLDDEVRDLVEINEGDGPDQVNIKAIFPFERQRDILRRLLQQGVKLDEAIPLAEKAGESMEPFDKVTAKRFVKDRLREIASSTDDIKLTSGSMRKRFRKLIVKGINVDKARILCQNPFDTKRAIFALRGIILEPKTRNEIARTYGESSLPPLPETSRFKNETATSYTAQQNKYKYVRPRDEIKREMIPTRRSDNSNETTTSHTAQQNKYKYVSPRYEIQKEIIPTERSDNRNETAIRRSYNTSHRESIHGREMMEQQFISPEANYICTDPEKLLQQKQQELALELLLQQFMPHLAESQQFSQSSVPRHGAEVIKLAVISPDFPLTMWPAEMLKGIQKLINQTARTDGIDLSDGCAKCSFRPGWIAYTIHDELIAQWFRLRVSNLRPYDAFVAVVDENEVPRSELFVAYIPEKRDISTEDLLTIIRKQNSDLRTQDWNVINRAQRGSILELNIVIDPFSAKFLKENNCLISYGYIRAAMKPRENINPIGPLSPNTTFDHSASRDENTHFFSKVAYNEDFSRRENDYARSSERGDDYINYSRREDDYVSAFRREDVIARSDRRGNADSRHSRREEYYVQSFRREDGDDQFSRRENNNRRYSRRDEGRASMNQRGHVNVRTSSRKHF
ncbi:uncharacterized protein [Eurosta solidaginis]|uniref:uncharacterized protein n=1 Tax=Eurosta solidaginis TaxID=178769 RepID=UPI003530F798